MESICKLVVKTSKQVTEAVVTCFIVPGILYRKFSKDQQLKIVFCSVALKDSQNTNYYWRIIVFNLSSALEQLVCLSR